jgi:hypothetical protein
MHIDTAALLLFYLEESSASAKYTWRCGQRRFRVGLAEAEVATAKNERISLIEAVQNQEQRRLPAMTSFTSDSFEK